MIDRELDILIIGGGLIGATLLHALKGLGLETLLVEAKPLKSRGQQDFDARSLALSAASVRILSMLNLWDKIEPLAYKLMRIHVSEQGRFGTALLEHPNPDQALGYIIEMQAMQQILSHLIDESSLLAPAELIAFDPNTRIAKIQQGDRCQTIRARLCVAADGADSKMREYCQLGVEQKRYSQDALVCNLGLRRSHHDLAYERFTPHGPLALLPLGPKRMTLVWSLPSHEAARLEVASDQEFEQALRAVIGYRLGRLEKIGQRKIYPLQHLMMPKQFKDSVVFIGNAAHTLHPVAGQGFNLGLRDLAMLVQMISQQGLDNLNDLLDQYQQARQADLRNIANFTDGLVRLFSHAHPGLRWMRQLGLVALDNSPGLKRILSRHASGLAGELPDWVCRIPVEVS